MIKLPYAVGKNNQIFHIDEVMNANDREFKCLDCGHSLIVKSGPIRARHFAHKSNSTCSATEETILHLAAKSLIVRNKKIKVPGDIYHYSKNLSREIIPERIFCFDEVESEKVIAHAKVDILATIRNTQLAIEIAVTHHCDESKIEKFRKENISLLELDLSKVDRKIRIEELERVVIHEVSNKKWLFNKVLDERRQLAEFELEEEYIRRVQKLVEIDEKTKEKRKAWKKKKYEWKKLKSLPIIESRFNGIGLPWQWIPDCPLEKRRYKGQIYANLEKDCKNCDEFRGFVDGTHIACNKK